MELIGLIVLFAASIFALVKASDWFIGAAEAIGLAAGISPFIIGVTLVAFGTSLPELAASIAAVLAGNSQIVIGNVVGSNITNILLIVGVSAVVGGDIVMNAKSMDNNIVMLLVSTFLLWFTVRNGEFAAFEAVLFLIGLVLFILSSFRGTEKEENNGHKAGWKHYVMLLLGAGLIYLGARYTIFSLVRISDFAGIPSEIIALTGVALGTSLPEVAVSISAIRKGKSDIAIGNVLGSNIFNSFAVMGIPGLMGKLIIPETILVASIPLMIAVTVMFCFMFMAPRITRWEGTMLLVFYAFFVLDSFFS